MWPHRGIAGFGDEASGLLASACGKLGQHESSMAGLLLSEEALAAARTRLSPASGLLGRPAKVERVRWDESVKDNAPKAAAAPPEPPDDGAEFDVLAYAEALESGAAPARGRGRSQSTFSAGDRAAPPALPATPHAVPPLEAFDPTLAFDVEEPGGDGMEEYDPHS